MAAAVVPEDGTYLIQVRESSFGGSNACRYRLHVGRFSRPLAAFPPGGKPGQPIEVRWLGDPQGQWTQEVSLPGSTEADFGLFAEDDQGIAPSGNVFRLGELENVLEVDPNDTPAEATPFQTPAALVGAIDKPGDTDRFRFTSKKGQVLDVTVYARRLRSPLDSVLNIRRSSGAGVSTNDDSGNPDSYIRFRAPEDGDYVITLTDHLGQGGPEYVYRVEIEPVQPRLQMGFRSSRRLSTSPCRCPGAIGWLPWSVPSGPISLET